MINISHSTHPEVTFEDIVKDLEAAKLKFHYNDLCFTWATVEALVNCIIASNNKFLTIKEQSESILNAVSVIEKSLPQEN